jgi:hypothetical protein
MELTKIQKFVQPPGDNLLFAMMHPSNHFSREELLTSGKAMADYLLVSCWVCSMHWMFKFKYKPSHNPATESSLSSLESSVIKRLKPMGQMFAALLTLVEYLHQSVSREGFDSHWIWFQGTAKELFLLCTGSYGGCSSRQAIAKEIRSVVDAIRHREVLNLPRMPHFSALICAVYSVDHESIHRHNIDTLLVKINPEPGLLKAMTAIATQLVTNSGFSSIAIKADKLLFNSGKGRTKQIVDSEKISNRLKTLRRKQIQDKE